MSIETEFNALKAGAVRFRTSSVEDRIKWLETIWTATLARKEDLFAAARAERGLLDVDIAAELVMLKGEIDHAVKNLRKWMKPQKVRNSLSTMGKRCEIRYQAKGVALNMAAYNAPTAESFVPMVAAIAAGNTVAIKPSELAPDSAQIIEDIVHGAFPADIARVFQGGVETAQTLLALPFDHIYYTGGTAVGKIVMKAAADNLASVTLEMGGKSPVIVDETASLENAATKLSWGRVMNAGQVCIAPEYALVQESIFDEFVTLVAEKMKAQYDSAGQGFRQDPHVPRLINDRHFLRVKALLDDAIAKGAKLVIGGDSDPDDRFIAPTILTDVSEEMNIMQEEVFGPILCIMPFSTREDVLAKIAPRPNPLAFYIYSTDEDAIEFYLANSSSGSAVVNNNCVQSGTNPRLPFGGIGASGQGRIGGFEGFKSMSNMRSVVHQPLDKFRDFLIMMPPYSDKYKKLIMKGLS